MVVDVELVGRAQGYLFPGYLDAVDLFPGAAIPGVAGFGIVRAVRDLSHLCVVAGQHSLDENELGDRAIRGCIEGQLSDRAGKYRLQMAAYALAAREVFGEAPRAASLLFLRAAREVRVEIDVDLFNSVANML